MIPTTDAICQQLCQSYTTAHSDLSVYRPFIHIHTSNKYMWMIEHVEQWNPSFYTEHLSVLLDRALSISFTKAAVLLWYGRDAIGNGIISRKKTLNRISLRGKRHPDIVNFTSGQSGGCEFWFWLCVAHSGKCAAHIIRRSLNVISCWLGFLFCFQRRYVSVWRSDVRNVVRKRLLSSIRLVFYVLRALKLAREGCSMFSWCT